MPIPEWAIGIAVIILVTSLARGFRPRGHVPANRGASRSADDNAEVPQLRAELEDMRHRLTEVEERLDFTERLLAKQREAERLGPSR